MPLLAALERQDAVRWVLMRHENAAAMAAGAHARLTGGLGVCVATSGPGALNALSGVVDADLDRVPLLLLTGLVPTAQVGHWEFQDIDQAHLFGSVLAHSANCIHPGQLAALLRNFVGRAGQQQRAVHLALPSDVLAAEIASAPTPSASTPRCCRGRCALMPPPDPALDLVAAELERFELPLIVVGRRAVGCGPAIEQLAERLGAPIITALDGKGIVDESHPNVLGVLGVFGFPAFEATKRILQRADVILAIGVDTIKPFLTEQTDVQHRALIQCEAEFSFLTHEYHRDRTLVGPLDAICDGLRDRVRARPRQPGARRRSPPSAPPSSGDLAAEPRAGGAGGTVHPRDFLLRLGETPAGRGGGRARHRRPHPLGGAVPAAHPPAAGAGLEPPRHHGLQPARRHRRPARRARRARSSPSAATAASRWWRASSAPRCSTGCRSPSSSSTTACCRTCCVQQAAPLRHRRWPIPTSSRWPAPMAPRRWSRTPSAGPRRASSRRRSARAACPLLIDLRVDPGSTSR